MDSNKNEMMDTATGIITALKDFTGDHADHLRLLKQVDKLRAQLESPMDIMMKQWETTQCIAAINLLVEMDVFEAMPKEASITTEELAAVIHIDESAISRALKLVVVHGICVETAPNTFALNANASIYLQGGGVEFFKFGIRQTAPFLKLPGYFRTHAVDDLWDLKKSPYAWAVGMEGSSYYDAIAADPEMLHCFNFTMAMSAAVTPILGMFPFASLREQVEADPSRPFAVDIGGGRGQFLLAIEKEEAPDGFGARMILQDLPQVIDTLTAADIPKIEKMAYDFFTPQPVKNAHLYLMRRVLHDFSIPVCIQMLKSVASAMGPSSRLIISDMLLPEKAEVGDEVTPYWMDFNLMLMTGMEKTQAQFEHMAAVAGLEIVKIYHFSFGPHVNIECRLKTT